jgi:hypothetical protein
MEHPYQAENRWAAEHIPARRLQVRKLKGFRRPQSRQEESG